MDKINIKVLTKWVDPTDATLASIGRMTMHGYDKEFELKESSEKALSAMSRLPHGSLRRFTHFQVMINGLSRRALAQITRHKVGIEFISSSMHYQTLEPDKDLMVKPFEYFTADKAWQEQYDELTNKALQYYKEMAKVTNSDAAGYMLPLATRGRLLVDMNAEALVRLCHERICKRSTHEIRYICFLILDELWDWYGESIFHTIKMAVPECMSGGHCKEGKMCCGYPYSHATDIFDNPDRWRQWLERQIVDYQKVF